MNDQRRMNWWSWLARVAVGVGVAGTVCLADEQGPESLDVPFEGTPPAVVDAMLTLANVSTNDRVYDLGCGDGRIVVEAARKFGASGVGVDLDPERIKEANENAEREGVRDKVQFRVGDIFQTDISGATVVTLYLLNPINLKLRPKLLAELSPGTPVVSHAFHMDDWDYDQLLHHPQARGKTIYLWLIPARVGGTWRWKTRTTDGEIESCARLHQEFQVVSGSISLPHEPGKAVEIDVAQLHGRELQFEVTMDLKGQPAKVQYRGRVEGDTVRGVQMWHGAGLSGQQDWTAQRQPQSLAGRWQVTVADMEGALDGVLEVVAKDQGYVATYRTADGATNTVATAVYCWGSSVRLEFLEHRPPLIFRGDFDADEGHGRLVRTGWNGNPTWSAKRQAEGRHP